MNMFANWIKKWVCLWIHPKNEYIYEDSKKQKKKKKIIHGNRDSKRLSQIEKI